MQETVNDASTPPGASSEGPLRARRALLIAMAALGVLIIGLLPPLSEGDTETRVWADFGLIRWALLAVVITLLLLPPVVSRLAPLLERLREVSPSARPRIALAIAVLAGVFLLWTAWWQDRDFFPKTHDEQSYLLQIRMLSQGRLWMPAHELADFFETFHVMVEPVYASVYFPGTAMMYVAGLWLGWPAWLLPLIIAAACVGLLYAIVTDLVDGLAGLLAVVLMLSLSWFRMLSIMLMGQIPALFLGLLMFWAWLRWREARAGGEAAVQRRSRQLAWVALIGACAGWMAITRPVDALAYAIPVGIGMLIDLYRRHSAPQLWLATLGLLVAAAAPFLTVQIIFNKGVTGSYMHTPFRQYIDLFQPQTSFGFHDFDPSVQPDTKLAQKHALYELFVVPRAKNHTPQQLPANWAQKYFRFTLDVTTPARPLIILLPIGLLAVAGARQWVLVSTAGLFIGLYALYTFYLEHYIVVIAPAMILLAVLSMRALERAWPGARPRILCIVTGVILFACASMLPQTHPRVTDETFPSAMLRVLRNLDADGQKLVILVRWVPGETPTRNYHQEPVYNLEAAWPDDNDIIFAHDLAGDVPVRSPQWWQRNRRIFEYYAQHQPQRRFIVFDRGLVDTIQGDIFEELGSAPALAQEARQRAN